MHFPDVEKLIALADFFHVTTDYLLGRCRTDLSPDVFNEVLTEEKTVGELIQDMRSLTPNRRQILAVLLSDMKLGAMIRSYNREKS